MDNRYYDNVIYEMNGFLTENNFKADGEFFVNDTKKISVKYDDATQSYQLLTATKDDEGNFGELTIINSWLFDDTQNAKDATSVGIDFVVSLRKELGIKQARATASVELPSANKSGAMTVTGFTKKMLDVFPAIKDDYKEHISIYGNFLYINFFGEYLVPQLKSLFTNGNKKQVKKLYDVFEDAYVKGDRDTVNIMIALLSATAYNDAKCAEAIENMLIDDNHFLQSYKSFSATFKSSKKLFSALVK
ncbi:MAG: hypothetical protein J6B22_06145 [Clostridia bacterium]|nr:hypothetical protein [Clostridia bacterium]